MARRQEKEKKQKPIRYFDYSLLFLIIFLLCFGLVMLYSTSSYYGSTRFGDTAYYLKKQLFATSLGIIAMIIVSRIPYRFWMRVSGLAYLMAFGLCTAVIFIGTEAKGQARWIYIGPLSFQPSEFAKLAVIIFLATIIYKTSKQVGDFKTLVKVMAIVLPVVGVVAYNNLSTAIIVAGITGVLIFVAHPKIKPFLQLIAAGAVVVVVGLSYLSANISSSENFRLRRIITWLDPENHADEGGFQVMQGLYAIGSGGFFGKGLGNSTQKLGVIPEVQNDMILTIVCEELGVFGVIVVLVLFGLLLYRLMFIAKNAPDLYGSLVASGIFAHISLQVILNIAVVTNMMPTTGVTLPFISYGGTSILFLMTEMGIALGISRKIKLKQ